MIGRPTTAQSGDTGLNIYLENKNGAFAPSDGLMYHLLPTARSMGLKVSIRDSSGRINDLL
jgi:hypothetical protein